MRQCGGAMIAKRSLEELRDMLPMMEQDAYHLAQCNHLTGAHDLFISLAPEDRRRLVALALMIGSDDARSVACYLMTKLDPEPGTLPELLEQIPRADVSEMRGFASRCGPARRPRRCITNADFARILEELNYACEDMGPKALEEAYWVFIAEDLLEDADWVTAMGGDDDIFAFIGSTVEVGFHPNQTLRQELVADMHQARWILHLHNHPNPSLLGFDPTNEYYPSEHDLGFARYWMTVLPDLAERMLFFVVREKMVVQYALPHNRMRRWV